MIRYDLEKLYGRRILLNMFTDSKQLIDVVIAGFPKLLVLNTSSSDLNNDGSVKISPQS